MPSIMADHNIEGHFVELLRIWTSEAWKSVWESLAWEVESFARLGIPHDTSDRDLWQLCQQCEIVLLTANRSLPDTFCRLNDDMESDRNQEVCIQKVIKKSQSYLEQTYITAISTMDKRHPAVFLTDRTEVDNPNIG